MKIYIDQSGKIEDTAKPTILAFSNHTSGSIIIKAIEKRKLQSIYRKAGKPRTFIIQVFASLVYLLIKCHKLNREVLVIDEEYCGHEDQIKSYLVQAYLKLKKIKSLEDRIEFRSIGKSNKAHLFAYGCFKKQKGDYKITAEDILALTLLYEH